MKYTNKHNIPIEIIRAVENDSYSKGDSVKSVTGLLQPPQISILSEHHHEELTADISERIWILLGQSVHTILERANEGKEGTLTEERMFGEVGGWSISGQTDSIALDEGILKDYKVTSVWNVVNALQHGKPEWKKEDTYRVMKKGRKSALRVLDSQQEADKYIDGHKDEKDLSVELALGKAIRCESYCLVAEFCNQYQEEKADE